MTLHTTDQADAGFDGEVYVLLTGENGETESVLLVSDSIATLAPASSETYVIRASDVGTLRSASVRIVGNKKEKKWHLDRLEVANVPQDGSEPPAPAVFIHRNWVESETVTLTKDLPVVEYKITAVTGSAADAGFDGDIFITINGAEGSTEELKLVLPAAPNAAAGHADNRSTIQPPPSAKPDAAAAAGGPAAAAPAAAASKALAFAAGSTQLLTASSRNVGRINNVTVRLAPSSAEGASTKWFLEALTVTEQTSGIQAVFPHKAYLSSDCASTLYMPSSYTYTVRVKTSDVAGADFDGDLYVVLATWWEESEEQLLSCTRATDGKFARGSTEEFTVKVDNISYVRNVHVRAAAGPDTKSKRWHAASIEVARADYGNDVEHFHVHDWVNVGADKLQVPRTDMATYDLTLFLSPAAPATAINPADLQLWALPVNNPGARPCVWRGDSRRLRVPSSALQ